MTRVYLDIETFREDPSNPFNEKVIAIGVLEDWTPYNENSLKKEVNFKIFSEWELGDEKTIIKEFYSYIHRILSKSKFLNVIGFNILRFDIPLLIQKGVEFGIGEISELNKFWHNTFTADLFQMALITNNMRFSGNKLKNLVNAAKNIGINISQTYKEGGDIKKLYINKEYSEIERHLEADLRVIRELDITQSIFKIIKS